MPGLTIRIKNAQNKLHMNNFFSSPDLFHDLHTKTTQNCGTVRPNEKGMPWDFGKIK
jgi:hypothetical protein